MVNRNSASDDTPSDALARRYGKQSRPRPGGTSRPRWPLIIFGTSAIAAMVAFAAWLGFEDKPVSSQVFGYDVVSDTKVTVTIDVVTPRPVAVVCSVYAQAEDQAIVGEKTVRLEPSKSPQRRVSVDLKTQRRAVTGTLRSCDVA